MTQANDLNHTLFDRAAKVIPGGVNSPVRAFRAVEADARRSLDTQFAAVRAKMSAHRDQTD